MEKERLIKVLMCESAEYEVETIREDTEKRELRTDRRHREKSH